MRIALFTEVFLPKIDGIVTRLMRTLEQLDALGHEVIVFAPGKPVAEYQGFRVVPVNSVPFWPVYPELPFGLPTAGIAWALEEFRPDVVHAINPVVVAGYGVLAAKRRGIPLVASFHTDLPLYMGSHGAPWLRWLPESLMRTYHNRADLNLATSGQMIERAREVGVRRMTLWPKGVDTVNYHPGAASPEMRERLADGHPEDPLVVYVGRLSKEKDLDQLLHLVKTTPVRLAFVGSGPGREDLEVHFAGTRTIFTGYMSGQELAAAFASADVFAFPSTTETLGLVALESMASGVPVVGADAGGIPFVIDDGETGLLVRPRDEEHLTSAIMSLIEDPERRARLARAAREEAERHSWRSATEGLITQYERAIELHGAPGLDPSRLMRLVSQRAIWRRRA